MVVKKAAVGFLYIFVTSVIKACIPFFVTTPLLTFHVNHEFFLIIILICGGFRDLISCQNSCNISEDLFVHNSDFSCVIELNSVYTVDQFNHNVCPPITDLIHTVS